MTFESPVTELSATGTSADVTAVPWTEAEQRLQNAGVYWLSTVRPDGRPHVTPLIGVWLEGALYFDTVYPDRKAKNLAANPNVVITTGSNALRDELDIVVEGEAVVVRDEAKVSRVGDAFVAKYGEPWRLPGLDGVNLFEVAPATAFGFGRGDAVGPPPHGGFSQTRWRFSAGGR
jgi:nitroimidazol reductase NimA-like FMN-containing flavoprotein (pyridoxamine 5'-phosphate oxidase superfamily)